MKTEPRRFYRVEGLPDIFGEIIVARRWGLQLRNKTPAGFALQLPTGLRAWLDESSVAGQMILHLAPNFLSAGPLTMLQFVMRDFQEWIEVGIRLLSYHTNGITFCKVDTAPPGHIAYRFLSDPFVLSPHQQTERVVSLVVELARKAIGDPDRAPSRVRFSHAQPADTLLHERVFGCPIEFDCDHDKILFPQEFLDMPTNGSFRLLQPLITRFLHFRIERLRRYEPTTRTMVP